MQIKDAKEIPLPFVVEHIGGRYSHTDRHGNLWYFSPFRPKEKTASFKISPDNKTWYDFGKSNLVGPHTLQSKKHNGGDIIDLLCDYSHRDRRAGIKASLDELEALSKGPKKAVIHKREHTAQPINPINPRYRIIRISERITFSGLKEELGRRRISLALANKYLKQGQILDTVTGRKYTGFLFENDKHGYEVSIPNPRTNRSFKTCIGNKATTLLQPKEEAGAVDIFEGFWDFLSWLEINKIEIPSHYTIVLNSVSFTREAADRVIALGEQIQSVFLFMDNDDAGEMATHELALALEELKMSVGDMRGLYKNVKDLNAFAKTGIS